MGPDDPFEAARGALISAMSGNDTECSPRAAFVLGMALFSRGDLTSARTCFAKAQEFDHPDWSVGGLIGQAHLAARECRSDDAAKLFRQVIDAGRTQFLGSAWYNLGTIHQQRGAVAEATEAYRRAMETKDAIFGPKAATNLGFVLANDLHDLQGARQAFQVAIASGDPQQAQIAAQNLRAMDELDRARSAGKPLLSTEDDLDMSVPQGSGQVKRRWWLPWKA